MENKLPIRKNIRLPKHNYSAPGAYFITVCTQDKRHILSRIVGEGSVFPITGTDTMHTSEANGISNYTVGEGSALPKKTIVELSPCGRIIEKTIGQISVKYNDVSVDRYVIMPNHVHLLLSKKSSYGRADPSPTGETNIIDVIGWFKFTTAKEIARMKISGIASLWQRSFYDHIIRNEQDYYEIARYIEDNPLMWEKDSLYSPILN